MGQWHSWKEPAGHLAWLRSTGQDHLCPLSLVTPPLPSLHLLDRLCPCFSSVRHHICVDENQTGTWLLWLAWKRTGFPKGRGGSFEKAGSSFGISPNGLAGVSCECGASLTLGHRSLWATDGGNAFKETMGNVTVNGNSYLKNFSAVSFERHCFFWVFWTWFQSYPNVTRLCPFYSRASHTRHLSFSGCFSDWLVGGQYLHLFFLFSNSNPTPLNPHGLYVIILQLPDIRPDILYVRNPTDVPADLLPDLHEEILTEGFFCPFFQTVYSRCLHIMAHESHNDHLTGHLCYVYSRKKISLVSHEKVVSWMWLEKSKEKG